VIGLDDVGLAGEGEAEEGIAEGALVEELVELRLEGDEARRLPAEEASEGELLDCVVTVREQAQQGVMRFDGPPERLGVGQLRKRRKPASESSCRRLGPLALDLGVDIAQGRMDGEEEVDNEGVALLQKLWRTFEDVEELDLEVRDVEPVGSRLELCGAVSVRDMLVVSPSTFATALS
jgi:hypothetical protein